ncbi:MAG: metallophosphoesterase [Dehalococcoidia bacterium]|nr:metallophosphoesterase [Dehalococcoidia bacterium]
MLARKSEVLSRRAFLRRAGMVGAGLAVAPSLLWYGKDVEPGFLEVTRLKVNLPRLPAAFEGMTIAQLSDIHFGPFVKTSEVREAVDATMQLEPDLVVVTGDFVSRVSYGEAELIVQEFTRLRAPMGVYGILGNHDIWNDSEVVADGIRRAGLTLLRNSNVFFEAGGDRLYLAGIDDFWERRNDLPLALKGVPDKACAILLAHEPDFADEASADGRPVFQMSGHSHGGQIKLPVLGPPQLPQLGRKYPEGLRKVGQMWLYTNRGVGVVSPPLRFNCRPEVTFFELVREF